MSQANATNVFLMLSKFRQHIYSNQQQFSTKQVILTLLTPIWLKRWPEKGQTFCSYKNYDSHPIFYIKIGFCADFGLWDVHFKGIGNFDLYLTPTMTSFSEVEAWISEFLRLFCIRNALILKVYRWIEQECNRMPTNLLFVMMTTSK